MLFTKKMTPWLFVLALTLPSPALAQAWSPEGTEAKGVLLHYLDALGQGDTYTLRSLMAGDLLNSRTLLLENPLWPAHLGSTFGNAEFSIQGMEAAAANQVTIDVSIRFGEDDFVLRRFVLQREETSPGVYAPFRVVEEHDPGLLDLPDSSPKPSN